MPLNLSVQDDGEFLNYVKFNAKAGRFYVKGDGSEVEVMNPRFVVDMEHIKTGWIFYQEGMGPERIWDPSPTQMAPRPAGPKKWKRGFELLVFGPDTVPGVGKIGLREFSSTANSAISAIIKMYSAYEAGVAQNPGKLPFFQCVRVIPIQGSFGTNYEPAFEMTSWVDRKKVPAFEEALKTFAAPSAPPRSGIPSATSEDDFGGAPARPGREFPGHDDSEMPF